METTTTERVDADLSTPDVAIRILATSGNADDRYPVPSKQRFKDAGEGVIEADDLEHIAQALIRDDTLPLGHLAALRIGYLWAERGGSQGGFPCFGRLIKASKALLHYAEIDYLVMLSADHLRDAKATRWQVEALVGHQLGHIEMLTTEKGEDRYSVKGHDFEGFAFEFKRWGAYLPGMVVPAQAASSAVQMGLIFEESEDEGEEDGEGEDFDPTVAQAPEVDEEIGPEPDGAPMVDWSETFKDDPGMLDLVKDEQRAAIRDHADAVRANFKTMKINDQEFCAACGVDVFDHDPEVCQGGTPETRKRRSRKMPVDFSKIVDGANGAHPKESSITDESPVSEPYSGSALPHANGNHDAANVAGLLLDPDRVCRTLSERGWKIAYQHGIDGEGGGYVNSETFAAYDTGDVETSYRAALAGRAR
jgi:hypothetical protein